ncbi:MAG: helix-turn-helix domain-containing protein [Bacteroidales bacterium]|nr:helix-turn-helix domain-containing protein [Bacteroidales bacterium]MBR6178188.1 helix-turn-helix domain-containing protein [Bacteroidales bacterium]
MEVKEILRNLREKNNLTQEQMAERVNVSRQAISRWENGETQPNTDMLKTLSKEFNVSINTLLGSPQTLICQCCGMPLTDDSLISHEPDGAFNEDYCKWCYVDGKFAYSSKDLLLDFLVKQMPNPDNQSDTDRRALFDSHLSQLKHWKV